MSSEPTSPDREVEKTARETVPASAAQQGERAERVLQILQIVRVAAPVRAGGERLHEREHAPHRQR